MATKQQRYKCPICQRNKTEDSFYKNLGSASTNNLDLWCIDCVIRFVKDKNTLMQYCKSNNRVFLEDLWDKELTEARNEAEEINFAPNESADQYILEKAIGGYLNNMSGKRYKDKTPPLTDDTTASQNEHVAFSYDEFWDGTYTEQELNKLNHKLKEYENDFDVPDVHTRDMFKKIVKMSVMQDEAMRKVEEDPSKENIDSMDKITKMLNTMSDSMKLSLSKRTANDRGGFTDLGRIIDKVESTGALMRKQEYPQDDCDIITSRYIGGIAAAIIDENMDMRINDEELEAELNGS